MTANGVVSNRRMVPFPSLKEWLKHGAWSLHSSDHLLLLLLQIHSRAH